VRLVNVTDGAVVFECGQRKVSKGTYTVYSGGAPETKERIVWEPIVHTVPKGGDVELADGYCVPRQGHAGKFRPSFLEESGLVGKLVPADQVAKGKRA
jgi:hypothetical protein